MNTLPETIQIGGHTISVTRRDNLMSRADAYGMFDGAALEISVDSALEDSLVWETFWHEVVEALNFFSEADMAHRDIQVFGLLLHQVAESVHEHVASAVPTKSGKKSGKEQTPLRRVAKRIAPVKKRKKGRVGR
jgi:hypothetical protein